MRVIAGSLRGRPLDAPDGLDTRPMTDRAKETIFNILGSRFGTLAELPPLAVLDLFAGTGGMGIEALSRGAASCLFFERDRRAVRCLRSNIERFKLGEVATVSLNNAWTTRFVAPPGGFGLVFVDPPYRDVESPLPAVDLLERLGGVLAADGVVVFRYESKVRFPLEQLRGVVCADERRLGRMVLLFCERADTAAAAPQSLPPEGEVNEAADPLCDNAGDDNHRPD